MAQLTIPGCESGVLRRCVRVDCEVTGPDNIIYFFMDDLLSNPSEAGSGFVDRIQVTVPPTAVPPPSSAQACPGLMLASVGLLGWWRRKTV